LKIAFKIFKNEIKELMDVYNSSLIAYSQTKKIQLNINKFSKEESDFLLDNIEDFTNDNVSLEFSLRELIHIRLISILELYLIDNIKYIFTETKLPFKTKNIITFQLQELLSFKTLTEVHSKIISKDCRQLSSGGFDKIIKYYKDKFKLDLNSFLPSKERILEYHERRHLLVHNLGKTDKQYRAKYKTTKLGLSISDEYLRNAIIDIETFAEIVNKNTLKFIDNSKLDFKKEKVSRTVWFSFKNLNDNLDLIEDDFGFWSNDDLVYLKDILIEKNILPDNFLEIKISGEHNTIRDYLNIIRKTSKSRDDIKYFQKLFDDHDIPKLEKKIKPEIILDPKPKMDITPDLILTVKNLLPEKPWPTGIHRKIADDLNISSSTIRKVVNRILRSE
jgi:hypothetical protein